MMGDQDTLRPVDREAPTSPHHEIPEPLSGAAELRSILGQVLDEKLEPLLALPRIVSHLQISLDLAVDEMRRQNQARKSEIIEVEGKVDTTSQKLAEFRLEILAALATERQRIDEIERDVSRIIANQ